MNFEASEEAIRFLDLRISTRNDRFVTTTFFSSDRNAYISLGMSLGSGKSLGDSF